MKDHQHYSSFASAVFLLIVALLGCGKFSSGPHPEWTRSHKIAGKEQRLSHISGIVVDDQFAYVTMGGTVADEQEKTSGLRKVALDSGAVMTLDDGRNFPQSDSGGIAIDEHFIYWNGGGKILRISKAGGEPTALASEHVGIGIDIALDDQRVYWANHGYYSGNAAPKTAIYSVSKQGGTVEIFADQQDIPHSLVVDEKFLYWLTPASVLKQAKTGGPAQVIFQAGNDEGVDELAQDGENLYFGFRSAGNSRWALRKVSKQGGEPQTLVKTYSLKPVVVDETSVYFFDEDGLTTDVFCKVSKNGGAVTRLDTGYSSGVITQGKRQVYFASLDDVLSFNK